MSFVIRSQYVPFARHGISFSLPSMTQQHFKDECNINNIMAKYLQTGILVDPLQQCNGQPQFGDYTAIPDYQEAQQVMIDASNLFDSLPALLRKRFHNSPGELLEFLDDRDNLDEAVKLGLVAPAPAIVNNDNSSITNSPNTSNNNGNTTTNATSTLDNSTSMRSPNVPSGTSQNSST